MKKPKFVLEPKKMPDKRNAIDSLCIAGATPNFLHPYKQVIALGDELMAHYKKGDSKVTPEEWAAVSPMGKRMALFLLAREMKKIAVRLKKHLGVT